MADEEALRILMQGVSAWNAWRDENPEARPNLRLGDFTRAQLDKVNFKNTDLRSCCFARASLVSANLHSANLRAADLTGADLRNVDFNRANLTNALLARANLAEAVFCYTIVGDVNLSEVQGLDNVSHLGPSTIGIDTLTRSRGKISAAFLRKAGVPRQIMETLTALGADEIALHSCFISYSHADYSFAIKLYDSLQAKGVSCWLDRKNLLPGENLYSGISGGIRTGDRVLLCASKSALTSWWVDNELSIAFAKEQEVWRGSQAQASLLIPLNLDDFIFSTEWKSGKAEQIRSRFAADFTGWELDEKKFDETVNQLLEALRRR